MPLSSRAFWLSAPAVGRGPRVFSLVHRGFREFLLPWRVFFVVLRGSGRALGLYPVDAGGVYKLGERSFRTRVRKGRASLFVLGGGGKYRITVAGCKNTLMTVVIPSHGKGVTGIMRKRSGVRSIMSDPRPFLDALVNHCNGHVYGKGFALRKGRCGLTVGGKPGDLRKNPANYRTHI